jgi:hypothetical protein
MARKPTEVVAVTLRIREDLRRRLERAARKAGVSLNAEMEKRLEDSFDLANTGSLIRVLVGGGFIANLLGAIAKVFEVGGNLMSDPERIDIEQRRLEAAYVALILIFTDLFSTSEHPLDPAMASPVIDSHRGLAAGNLNDAQEEGYAMAEKVLRKVEYPSHWLPSDVEPTEGGLLKFFNRKKEGTR